MARSARIIAPATATAPPVIWRRRMRNAPVANRIIAVTTAVQTIRRPTARCVFASKCLVFSRNGTKAILGPMPISRSRSSFVTNSTSITEKSIQSPLFSTIWARETAAKLSWSVKEHAIRYLAKSIGLRARLLTVECQQHVVEASKHHLLSDDIDDPSRGQHR